MYSIDVRSVHVVYLSVKGQLVLMRVLPATTIRFSALLSLTDLEESLEISDGKECAGMREEIVCVAYPLAICLQWICERVAV